MKFKNGRLKFKYLCNEMRVHAYNDGSILLSVNTHAIPMTHEEARKFAKAIRKQVKLAEMGEGH